MTLDALERWFDGQVAGPWEGRRAPRPAPEAVVLPNARMTSRERIDIYTRMYFARLHEALGQDYPALRGVLGDDAFERLARGYVAAHPSRSHSLNFLGRAFPAFLTRAPRVPDRAAAVDIARIECAMSEVFDEEEARPLTPGEVALVPPGEWGRARLDTIPAFRLLALRTRANAAVTAARQALPLPRLGAHRSWVAVYRQEYRVVRLDLSRPQFALLDALHRGKTVRTALAAALRDAPRAEAARIPGEVFGWFRDWTAEGIFRAVRLSGR